MEMSFEGDIIYLIEVEQEDNAIIQTVESPCNDSNISGHSSTIILNIDPCLTEEAHISDMPEAIETHEYNEQMQIAAAPNLKSFPPNILRSSKNKLLKCKKASNVGKSILIKNDILQSKTPKLLEMAFIDDIAHITFKDEKDHQMFLTQQLKVKIIIF